MTCDRRSWSHQPALDTILSKRQMQRGAPAPQYCTRPYSTTSFPYEPRISTIIFHIIRHSPEAYSARTTLRRRRVARYLDDDDDGSRTNIGGESNPLCEIRVRFLERLPGTGGRGGSRESCQWAALHWHTAHSRPFSLLSRLTEHIAPAPTVTD